MSIIEVFWDNPAHRAAVLNLNIEMQNEGYLRHNLEMPQEHREQMQKQLVADLSAREEFRIFLSEEGASWNAILICSFSYSTYALKPILYCQDLWVHPEARRRGIARALIEHAYEYAKSNNCARMELTTTCNNIAAGQLYQSLGFTCAEAIADGTAAAFFYAQGLNPAEHAITLKKIVT